MARLGSKRSGKWSSALLLVALVAPMISAELPRVEEVAALAATGVGGDKPIVPFLLPAVQGQSATNSAANEEGSFLDAPLAGDPRRKLQQQKLGGYIRVGGPAGGWVSCGTGPTNLSAGIPCVADVGPLATFFVMTVAYNKSDGLDATYYQMQRYNTTDCLTQFPAGLANSAVGLFLYRCTTGYSQAFAYLPGSWPVTGVPGSKTMIRPPAGSFPTSYAFYYAGIGRLVEGRLYCDPRTDVNCFAEIRLS